MISLLFPYFSSFFFSYLTSQHLPHFGFWKHIPKFDILGNLIGSQPVSTPLLKFVTTDTSHIGLSPTPFINFVMGQFLAV